MPTLTMKHRFSQTCPPCYSGYDAFVRVTTPEAVTVVNYKITKFVLWKMQQLILLELAGAF
jgi:hypothetical protein